MTQNERLKSTLLAIFRRKGQAGCSTRPFDEVEESTKRAFLGAVRFMEPDELAVLAILCQHGGMTIITTNRIIWLGGEKTDELSVEKICRVEPAQSMALVKKENLNRLRLSTADGGERFVETEPGPPFWGTWNLIGHFAVLNQRQNR